MVNHVRPWSSMGLNTGRPWSPLAIQYYGLRKVNHCFQDGDYGLTWVFMRPFPAMIYHSLPWQSHG